MPGKPDPTPAGPNEEDLPPGAVQIKRRSRVAGVMITQFVEEVPKGFTTPDFTRKPFSATAAEGKSAIFRAVVTGEPTPNVTWSRNKGDTADPEKYRAQYDEKNGEYIFEILNASADQADTYRFFATNPYGRAVCTSTLNIVEGSQNEPEDFRKLLKKTTVVRRKPKPKVQKEGEIDPALWDLLLSAPKKDYERICFQFGVTDFRWMLKKLNLMKKEREKEQAKFVEKVEEVKQIEVKPNGKAEFEVNMKLRDPKSQVLLYKDGEIIDYGTNNDKKHNLSKNGNKYVFSIKDLGPDDAGFYQIDVEDANVLSTDFKVPDVEFASTIKDCKAKEGEDATFECVLSAPVDKIMWYGNDVAMEEGAKHEITVSEDKLIHKLVIKDLDLIDQGTITAIAGIVPCKASLVVKEDPNRRKGKGSGGDDEAARLAAEKARLQKEKDDLEAKRRAQAERDAAAAAAKAGAGSGDGSGMVDGSGGDGSGRDGSGGDGSGGDGSGSGSGDGSGGDVSGQDGLGSGSDGDGSGDGKNGKLCFTKGLSDTYAIRGKPAEMACTLSSDKVDGVWSKDGEKFTSTAEMSINKDGASHKLIFQSAKDDLSGKYTFETEEIKTEASLYVGDLPEFDPDDLEKFAKPVIVKVGQNASFKMPFPPQENLEIRWFKDGAELNDGGGVKIQKEPNHSRLLMKDCIRTDSGEIKIQLKNPFGVTEAICKLIVLDKPGSPEGPVDVIDSTSSAIEFKWKPPKDDGGSEVTNYIIERQQVGQPMWKKLADVSGDRLIFRDRNVSHGRKYIYRIYAENPEGIGEPLVTEGIMAGTLVFPGPPSAPKVESAFKNCINLTWKPPANDGGTKLLGYQLEKRKKDTNQWIALNPANEPIQALKYAVKDVSEGFEYEFRVSAINVSGVGEPSPPSAMVCARNPKMRTQFKNPESFMVIRAGNSLRIKINYEAEPQPDITWLKDDGAVSPWVNIINVEGTSTLVIPTSKRSDSGIYTIVAKNSSGTASFDIEVRVTDEPKQPGPVELEQVVHGRVIITWAPSPDQELDDRLHYMVAEKESSTRIWRTIADRLFCNTFTANIHSGREYHFRVYAKNDMGLSDPSNSPTWGVNRNKVAPITSISVTVTLEKPPSIMVPLKVHTPPKGYQFFMTCAVRGYPTPYVFWYLNGVCINGNKNYYITNAHGICSMYILRVSPDDSGEYKVVAINTFGKAECSTTVEVKD